MAKPPTYTAKKRTETSPEVPRTCIRRACSSTERAPPRPYSVAAAPSRCAVPGVLALPPRRAVAWPPGSSRYLRVLARAAQRPTGGDGRGGLSPRLLEQHEDRHGPREAHALPGYGVSPRG